MERHSLALACANMSLMLKTWRGRVNYHANRGCLSMSIASYSDLRVIAYNNVSVGEGASTELSTSSGSKHFFLEY